MLKRLATMVMVALMVVCFANISEAASQMEEIHEVLIQVAKHEETDKQIYTISLVKIDDIQYFKTEKTYIDETISEHFVRYADSITGSVKKSYHWREKDGHYVKSPNDKPAKIYTHWK